MKKLYFHFHLCDMEGDRLLSRDILAPPSALLWKGIFGPLERGGPNASLCDQADKPTPSLV